MAGHHSAISVPSLLCRALVDTAWSANICSLHIGGEHILHSRFRIHQQGSVSLRIRGAHQFCSSVLLPIS